MLRISFSDKDADKRLSWFICSYILIQNVNLFVKMYLGGGSWWTIASRAYLGICLLLVVPDILRRNSVKAFFLETIFAIMLLFTYLRGTASPSLVQSITFDLLVIAIPLTLSVLSIKDIELLSKKLFTTALLGHIFVYPIVIRYFQNQSTYYEMGIGYVLLLLMIILMEWYLADKKRFLLFFVGIDAFIILAIASRGPVLCLFAYTVLVVFASNDTSKTGKIVRVLLLTLVVGVFLINYRQILNLLYSVFNQRGLFSRNISMLLNNSIMNDSGRSIIQDKVRDNIASKPLFGWGIGGGWDGNVYPHSIVLEIILSFGYPLGIVLLALVAFLCLRGVTTPNQKLLKLVRVFTAYSTSLLFSGSFVSNPYFFIAMAVCYLALKEEKHGRNREQIEAL